MIVKYFCLYTGICGDVFSKAHGGRKQANDFVNYSGCVFLNKSIHENLQQWNGLLLTLPHQFRNRFFKCLRQTYVKISQEIENKRGIYREGIQCWSAVRPKVGYFLQNLILYIWIECEKQHGKTQSVG